MDDDHCEVGLPQLFSPTAVCLTAIVPHPRGLPAGVVDHIVSYGSDLLCMDTDDYRPAMHPYPAWPGISHGYDSIVARNTFLLVRGKACAHGLRVSRRTGGDMPHCMRVIAMLWLG